MKKNETGTYPLLEEQRNGIVGNLAALNVNEFSPRMIQAWATRLTTKLVRIEKAITRWKNGHYGQCLVCQKPIETERLNILPYVEVCIHCQRKQEKTVA